MKTVIDKVENGGDVTLTTLAKYKNGIMLPTPQQRDYKGPTGVNRHSENLPDTVNRATGKTSQLNPLFVAEMMGFPPNWTELPFLSGEPNQSKDMETP